MNCFTFFVLLIDLIVSGNDVHVEIFHCLKLSCQQFYNHMFPYSLHDMYSTMCGCFVGLILSLKYSSPSERMDTPSHCLCEGAHSDSGMLDCSKGRCQPSEQGKSSMYNSPSISSTPTRYTVCGNFFRNNRGHF